jgi:hypothetical protein
MNSIEKMLDLAQIEKLNKVDLSNAINSLIEQDFHALVQILYRLDINENLLKQTLHDNPDSDAGALIADMIIQRQIQKEEFRKQFKQQNDIAEEDKW